MVSRLEIVVEFKMQTLYPFFLLKIKPLKNQYIAKALEKRVFKPKIALCVFINDVYSM